MRLTNSAIVASIRRRLGDEPADRLKALPQHVQLHRPDLDAALFSAFVLEPGAKAEPLRLARVVLVFEGGTVELEPEDVDRHPITKGHIESELPAAFAAPFKSGATWDAFSPAAPGHAEFKIYLQHGAPIRAELHLRFRIVDGAVDALAYYGDGEAEAAGVRILSVLGAALTAAGDDARALSQQHQAEAPAAVKHSIEAFARFKEAGAVAAPVRH